MVGGRFVACGVRVGMVSRRFAACEVGSGIQSMKVCGKSEE